MSGLFTISVLTGVGYPGQAPPTGYPGQAPPTGYPGQAPPTNYPGATPSGYPQQPPPGQGININIPLALILHHMAA